MRRGRPPHPDVLTPREQEVLSLIRDGLSNGQIADRLGISESGARYHVSEILSKLGVSSREEAAAWRPGREKRWSLAGGLSVPMPTLSVSLAVKVAGASSAAVLVIALVAGVLSPRALWDDLDVARLLATDDDNSAPAADGGAADPTMQRLLELEQEASQIARDRLDDAYLMSVSSAGTSSPPFIYGFRFAQRGSNSQVYVNGPYEGPLALQRWEILQQEVPSETPWPVLDLSAVENSFETVAAAAASASLFMLVSGDNIAILLYPEGDQIIWRVQSRGSHGQAPGLLSCQAPDADLSKMTCDQ